MYHPQIIQSRLTKASSALGFKVVPHSIKAVLQAVDHFDDLLDDETGELDKSQRPQGLLPEEAKWVANERKLCQCSFEYFATRYAWVINEIKEPTLFSFRTPQRLNMMIWAEHESKGWPIEIIQLKARQLGMCLDPQTKVLTDTLEWIPLEDVSIGQQIISTEEEPRRGRGNGRRMRLGVVQDKREVYEPAFKLLLDDGRELIATAQHRFLHRRPKLHRMQWQRVDEMKIGDKIRYITHPWEQESSYEDGWFGGILDGEGSMRQKERGGAEACVSQVEGDVLDRAKRYLSSRGYTYRFEVDDRKGGESSKFGNKPVVKLVVNRLNELFRLVGQTRPARFLNAGWWEGKELPGKKSGKAWAHIISIEPLGVRRMIDLQTSTKTFIAEGFVSHNSTLTELAIAHRVFFWPYTHALIASSDPDKSYEMSMMLDFVYERLPWWLAPQRTKHKSGQLMEFGGINTRLTIQHGNKISGLGRGSTPNIAHLSELPDFEDPAELVDASLMNAIHPNPQTFIILESTAKGFGNWWYDSWKLARRNWPLGKSRLRPVFLPWFTGTDIKPTPTWRAQHRHLLKDWEPSLKALRHKERAERFVHEEYPLLEQLLGVDWKLPKEQLLWWELTREEHVEKRILHKFVEENPADELEAFQNENSSVFTVEDMEGFIARAREPKAVYAITGTSIPEKFHPDPREIDRSRLDRLGFRVSYQWNTKHPGAFSFLPLKWRGYEAEGDNWQRHLLIWEYPIVGEEYYIGVDTSYGKGQDRSVIQVMRKGSNWRYDEQVAEFADPWISALELWPFTMALGTWYSQASSTGRYSKQCRMAIEVNALGEATQFEMKKRGWTNFHPWVRIDRKKIQPQHAVLEGWFTNTKSRHQMMVHSIRAVQSGALLINSRYLVEEMQFLQKDEDSAYISSTQGKHDDRWMSLGFGYYSVHGLEVDDGEKVPPPTREGFLESLPTYESARRGPTYDEWNQAIQQMRYGGG